MTHLYNLWDLASRVRDPDDSYYKKFKSLLQIMPPLNMSDGPWLAGGSIRRLLDGSKETADFDFFFKSQSQLEEFNQKCGRTSVVADTKFSVTMKYSGYVIQLVKLYAESASSIIDGFDFTACQLITDGNMLMVGEHTLYDIGRKYLSPHKIVHLDSSIKRLIKHINQGYSIDEKCIHSIVNLAKDEKVKVVHSSFETKLDFIL